MNAPPSTLPPGSIVDSYRRDSGGPRQEQSTDQQLRVIAEFCAQHGLIHRHAFMDKAESGGSTAGRDDFDRMISMYHIPAQRPHGLILWSYARFAREIENSIYFKAFIRTNKIIIHSLIDDIPEGDYGRVVEFFIDMSNEEKRKQASKESKRGLRDLVQQHGCVPGVPPRGFKRVPVNLGRHGDGSDHIAHRWEPDPKLRTRIRTAFKLRAAGVTLREIHKATRLYSSISSYKTFFTNKLYIGILEFGELVIPNYCKPLIPITTWNLVQKRIEQYAQTQFKHRHPRRASSAYLLSGIIRCAKCNAPLNGNTVTRETRPGRDAAYRCSRSKRRLDCDAPRIPAERLEAIVIEKVIEAILEPESFQAHQELAIQNETLGETVKQERLTALTHERAELSRQLVNLTNAIADSGHNSALLETLKQKETQRAQVRTELEGLEFPIQHVPPLTPAAIAEVSNRLIQLLTTSPPETRRQVLHGLIHEIHAVKESDIIKGDFIYYFPFDLAPQMLPMQPIPVGALLYRQRFTQPFEANLKPHSH